jgi:hypothetical protein
MAEPMTDLDLAVQMLLYKTPYFDRLWAYYDGNQPLVYSSTRLKEIFDKIDARFTQNWCAVVVDSVQERITLQRITVADNEKATKQMATLLDASSLMLEADDVHLAMLVTGEGYLIVWPDEETGVPQAYYNDSRNCHLFYEADRPRVKRFAVKWWIGDDNHRYLTLYYADRLEYYRSENVVRMYNQSGGYSMNEVTSGKSFESSGSERNPYTLIPAFHFRRERRALSSELQNVIAPQDAINKLLADMMVAAEFGAFKQRWIISSADPGKFKNSPNAIWDIPGGDGEGQPTSVGEFDVTPLANYIEAIDKWTNAIAIISRTPKHYFFGQGGDPSGEALIAMESPLNHKCEKYIERVTDPWTEVGQFMAMIGGLGEIESDAIIPVFDKPQTVQPYTQSLIRKESVAAGIPLMWQMKQEGYTEQELDELEESRTEQADADMERMAQVMEQRQSNFQQNGNGAQRNGQPPRGTKQSA